MGKGNQGRTGHLFGRVTLRLYLAYKTLTRAIHFLLFARESPTVAHMDTTARIRALRKSRGWSQEELAQKAEVSYRTIHAAETGAVSDKTLRRIALALGLEETALLPQEQSA